MQHRRGRRAYRDRLYDVLLVQLVVRLDEHLACDLRVLRRACGQHRHSVIVPNKKDSTGALELYLLPCRLIDHEYPEHLSCNLHTPHRSVNDEPSERRAPICDTEGSTE